MRQLVASILALSALCGHSQCSVDAGPDTVTIYWGYDPLSCTQLMATASGSGSLSLQWSTGDTVPSITVCDTVSAWYQVQVTDTAACIALDSVFVRVVDVHCGNTGNKVLVCHVPPGNPANAHTICVSANAVPAHIAHGCHLGACASDTLSNDSLAGGGYQLSVTPNPVQGPVQVRIRASISDRVDLVLIDAMGRERGRLYSGDLNAGEERLLYFGADELRALNGPAWLMLRGTGGRRAVVKLLLTP